MKKILQRIKRQYLSYSRADRSGLLIVAGLLLFSLLVNRMVDHLPLRDETDFSEIKRLIKEWESKQESGVASSPRTLFKFNPNKVSSAQLDSLDIPEQIKHNIISFRQAGGEFKNVADLRKIYGMNDSIYSIIKTYIEITVEKPKLPRNTTDRSSILNLDYFDPNNVTASELKAMGFSEYQAKNLVRYRSNGGRFRKPEDLLKIYGVDSSTYGKIKPFIEFGSTAGFVETPEEVVLQVELNSADSSQLVRLPGIGPAYAKRIIRYRELLGGYYSTNQLLEVYNFPSETFAQIEEYIYTDTLHIEKLRINFSEYSELLRHPYLSKTQVTQILNKREKQGSFKNLSELASLHGFDDETFKRIVPYLTCR